MFCLDKLTGIRLRDINMTKIENLDYTISEGVANKILLVSCKQITKQIFERILEQNIFFKSESFMF